MDAMAQAGIIIFGCSAIWLIGRKEEWKKWGYLAGLISQPFWFITAWQNKQWGIFIMACWYTYAWGQGIWNYIIHTSNSEEDKDKA